MGETKRRPGEALAEAARIWGEAQLMVNPNPPQPAPEAPAVAEKIERAA